MPTQKDPTTFGYQNFFSTTLTGDITSGTLTISLATVPSPTSGILIIEPDSTSSREVVFYTSKGASTVTCPSDGRGWSGSTAAAHLQGSTVIMASVDEYFEGLADGTLSTDPFRTQTILNHVVSGGVVAQSAGLVGTFSNIVFYINGQRYTGTSIANKTYTASKDTYVDITASSGGTVSVTYTEVANGAASPSLAANYIRIAKVVTNGSAITSVTQSQSDTVGNIFRPTGPFDAKNITNTVKFYVYRTAAYTVPSAFGPMLYDTKEFDTGNNVDVVTNKGRFTAPVSGFYWFASGTLVATSVNDHMLCGLLKNGAEAIRFTELTHPSASNHTQGGSGVLYLTAGDYVESGFAAGAAGRSIIPDKKYCWFQGYLISAA